ncbi:MAG: retron St85 family effector protein [Sulfuricurvum sp.]|nr:retron St85 family effector protein [Sulfuricurvum sp.]
MIITPSEQDLHIKTFKPIFKKVISIKHHLETIFVFGRAGDDPLVSNRAKFLLYLDGKDTPFNFVTIEDLYLDIKTYSGNNGITAKKTHLVQLELYAIEQAYSLIIFPESEGSYAELGYFTAIPATKKKIYVANDYNFSSERSYLNHLIEEAHNDRELQPLLVNFKSDNVHDVNGKFDVLMRNLLDDYDSNKNNTKVLSSSLLFLAVIYEVIRLVPLLMFNQVKTISRAIMEEFKEHKFDDKIFTVNISLLVVSKLISRHTVNEHIYFLPMNPDNTLISFDLTETARKKFMLFQLMRREETQVRLSQNESI